MKWAMLINTAKKTCMALNEYVYLMALPWQSYGTSPAIWDQAVLPATRHKWTLPTLTSTRRQPQVLDLPTLEGRKAELT